MNDQRPPDATHHVYFALGSNLGDREANLRAAVVALRPFVTIESVSSAYDTEPMLVVDQPRFLNATLAGWTALAPLDLLHEVKRIESTLGRQLGPRYGPRLIDIDLLLYDDLSLETPELTVPHPRLAERAFVLLPLAEIASDVQIPALGATIQMLARLLPPSDVRRIGALLP